MENGKLKYDFLSREVEEGLLKRLKKVYEAKQGTDGWIAVGNEKGVEISKRPAQEGERPWDTFKGSSVVNAPALFTLAYVHSFAFRHEWDEMYVKGEYVEVFDPLTKVSLIEFKAVWPASGRDFCNLVVLRELSEGIYCHAYQGVEFEKCPERQGVVRGEILLGGFVIKELSSDPPKCLVTYITRVDLKGYFPVSFSNRVTLSQPKAVAVVREKIEALYQKDLVAKNEDQSSIMQQSVNTAKEFKKGKERKLGGGN